MNYKKDISHKIVTQLNTNKWSILKWILIVIFSFGLLAHLNNSFNSLFADSKEDILNQIRETKDSIHVLTMQLTQMQRSNDSIKHVLEERGGIITSFEKKIYNVVVQKETNPDNAYEFLKAFAEKNGAKE
jgi:vacuolar-type H+-ATPase subunit E/Vma4